MWIKRAFTPTSIKVYSMMKSNFNPLVSWFRAKFDSKSGKCSTCVFFGDRHGVWRWFVIHLPNPGQNSVYIGMGRMVSKLCFHVLIYPGELSVCIGMGRTVKKPLL